MTEDLIGTQNQCVGIAEAMDVAFNTHIIELAQPWKTLSPWLKFEGTYSFKSKIPKKPWPDILIISGRKSIAVARYIKKQSNGKTFTVFIQDPRISPANFDMVIAPMHDPITGKNVNNTFASANKITKDILSKAKDQFSTLSSLPGPKAAILIGGNSKHHKLSQKRAIEIADTLKSLPLSLMITASRRTGEANAQILRDTLQGKADCYIWDGQGENPYFSMLAQADYIFVTNDSASMMSESCTTGKPVYILPLEGKSRRLSNLQERLIQRGAARIFDGTLDKWNYEPLNDSQVAAKFILEAFDKR